MRFQYSLRSLFLVTTLLCVALGTAAYFIPAVLFIIRVVALVLGAFAALIVFVLLFLKPVAWLANHFGSGSSIRESDEESSE